MARPSTAARDRLLATTQDLLRRQGYHATGLNQIVEESHAPKGSLYHYFPGGKEELAAEAVNHATTELTAQIQTAVDASQDTREAITRMGAYVANKLKTSSFSEACPISTVALETATLSPVLQKACSKAFNAMQTIIGQALENDGYSADEASELANLMVCAYLGGLLLSRTHQNTDSIQAAVRTLNKVLPTPKGPRKRTREQPGKP